MDKPSSRVNHLTSKCKRLNSSLNFLKYSGKSSKSDLAESPELPRENNTEIRQCLNCEEILSGLFCKNCGQKDVSYSKPLGSVISLFFDSWFSVDNRTLRSVFPLFFKPGYLSAQFVAGKRMSFASPIKLYLFSSICYFFLFNISLRSDSMANVYSSYNEKRLNKAFSKNEDAIKKAEALRNKYSVDPPSNDVNIASKPPASNTAKVTTETRFSGRLSEKVKDPENLRSNLLKGFSYMFFVLMPLFALFLKWFMGKKKQYYFDHLVLAIHLHAFALLFFSVLLLYGMILGLTINEYLLLVVVLYFIVSVKRFYSESWVKSIAKSAALLFVYGFFFTIVLVSTTLIIIAL
jgi:hypothetical protein